MPGFKGNTDDGSAGAPNTKAPAEAAGGAVIGFQGEADGLE